MTRSIVVKWCQAFEEGGYEALEIGRRGRRPQEQQRLAPHQCATIVRIITDSTPDQQKMPIVLWERVAVRELIQNKFGITLALRTITDYLRRWNMTVQKPVERAAEQRPAEVEKWLNKVYPGIRERAAREGAVILWSDETGVENSNPAGRSFSPRGKTPVIKKTGKKLRANMVSAVTNKGHVRFMIYTEKMTQQLYIQFLGRLVESFGQKVFVVVDNLKVHHGKLVRQWVSENQEKIELFFIPSYSPELNPDEYLNRDLKKTVHARCTPRTVEELRANVLLFMRKPQKMPERVRSDFNSRHITYAAG